jgi:hypothetical protein
VRASVTAVPLPPNVRRDAVFILSPAFRRTAETLERLMAGVGDPVDEADAGTGADTGGTSSVHTS